MVNYLGQLDGAVVEINLNGETQQAPLVGAFKNDRGYYVVLDVKEYDKQEFVMYKIIKDHNNEETIQVITDKIEWEEAYESWIALTEEALKNAQ